MRAAYVLTSLLAVSSSSHAELLPKGSIVCWGEGTLENYLLADNDKKRHMEEHECGIWNIDMKAEMVKTKDITVSGKQYSISNIILRYENYGHKEDHVWAFTDDLKSQ